MPEYPIFVVFDRIGTVFSETEGLYFRLRAEIRQNLPGFPRLYFHRPGSSLRLGLLSFSDGAMRCSSHISARMLGNPGEGRFSLSEEPWLPSAEYAGALEQQKDGGRKLLFASAEIPPEILPKFCFLRSAELSGQACCLLTEDADGNPQL